MSAGTRRDHDRFCVTERWTEVRGARGRGLRHHLTYELALPDGRVLRTRISRPVSNITYGPSLWSAILKDQLCVTESEFWACVRDGALPDRGSAGSQLGDRALPASLVYQLLHDVGLPENEVARMSLADAVAAMTEHWSKPAPRGS